MVLNTGLLDWESSALTTRPLLHKVLNIKVLRILWNKQSDEIIFKKHLKLRTFQQKEICLGLLNSFVFRLKVLFQKVSVQKLLCEQSLFDSLLTEWKVILRDLKVCESVKLLRWYGD